MGSRNDTTTFFNHEGITYVRCGCFYGDLAKFEQAVQETHGDNEHGIAYRKEIEKVKILFTEE